MVRYAAGAETRRKVRIPAKEIAHSALGLGKFSNLILTAREDHLPDHPSHAPGGPKIHFDLAGYDILLWHPSRPAEFRMELEKRINRRLAVRSESRTAPVENQEQSNEDRVRAIEGLLSMKFQAYMEIEDMANDGEGEKAIAAVNGMNLDGRSLNVNEARPKGDRSSGGGNSFRRKPGSRIPMCAAARFSWRILGAASHSLTRQLTKRKWTVVVHSAPSPDRSLRFC